jgi:hypothetical protein
MRIAHKLLPITTMAIAAIALGAPSAFAQTEPLSHAAVPDIATSSEPAGTPCPAVVRSGNSVSGGCAVHVGGPNLIIIGHLFGIESVQSTCNLEIDIYIDFDGEGYMTHQELTQGTQGTCTRRPCGSGQAASPEGRPWEMSARETGTVSPREVLTGLLCVENLDGSSPTHCEVDIPMTETSNHRYQLTAPGPSPSGGIRGHGSAAPFCEIIVVIVVELQQAGLAENRTRTHVEINHL